MTLQERLRALAGRHYPLAGSAREAADKLDAIKAFADTLDNWSVSAGMGGSPDACNAYEHAAAELRKLLYDASQCTQRADSPAEE